MEEKGKEEYITHIEIDWFQWVISLWCVTVLALILMKADSSAWIQSQKQWIIDSMWPERTSEHGECCNHVVTEKWELQRLEESVDKFSFKTYLDPQHSFSELDSVTLTSV